MGLPEPSKYVRASQPTISRFVRSGSKRTWEELDDITEDSDGTLDGFPRDMPAKRMAVDRSSDDEFGEFPALSQPDIIEKLDSSLVSVKEEKVVPKPTSPKKPKPSAPKLQKSSLLKPVTSEKDIRATVTSNQISDNLKPAHLKEEPPDIDFGEFPSLSQCDRLERDLRSARADPAVPKMHTLKIENRRKLNKPQAVLPVAAEFPRVTSQEVADMAATQLISEAAGAMSKSAQKNSTPVPLPSKPTPGGPVGSPRIANQPSPRKTLKNQEGQPPFKVVSSHILALKERQVNMPPPPMPFKAKKAISFAPSPNNIRPTILPGATRYPKASPNMPPSATQAFLEENIDDIYPSPSQQLRELFEEADDIPSNTQIAREISPIKPTLDDAFVNLFYTQDMSLSAEDLLEITTPSRTPTNQEEKAPAPAPEASREKRRFFEEKEDDLLHAALHESKILAAAQRIQNATSKEEPPSRAKRTLQRVKSNTSDYGDDFIGCSQELLALP